MSQLKTCTFIQLCWTSYVHINTTSENFWRTRQWHGHIYLNNLSISQFLFQMFLLFFNICFSFSISGFLERQKELLCWCRPCGNRTECRNRTNAQPCPLCMCASLRRTELFNSEHNTKQRHMHTHTRTHAKTDRT